MDLEPQGQGQGLDWTAATVEPVVPVAPGAGLEPPVAPGGDGGVGGEPPEAPAPVPALSVEEQYAKLGEPITRVKAAREADKAALPERQRKFLDSRGEVQRAAGEAAAETAPLRLDDSQRSQLEGLQGRLSALHKRVTPLPDSLVAEKAGRRGALSETDIVVRQETVAKWNEEIGCQQAVLESLDLEGTARRAQESRGIYENLSGTYRDLAFQAREAENRLVAAEGALGAEEKRLEKLMKNGLSEEEAKLILLSKPAHQQKTAASLEIAQLEQAAAESRLRAAEAETTANSLRAKHEAAEAAAKEVKALIGQRRAGIDAAVAEMTVSDGITNDTRQRLDRAAERIGRSQAETGQKLEADKIAGDIQEMQAFVDRIAGVKILPGGLENQLRLLDQRIDYLRQPGAIENLDPALAGAIEDAVDGFGGGDAGRERYLAKLLTDRTNLQILRDVADNPNSLIDAPYYVPEVLRQAVREAQEESVRGEKKQEEGGRVSFLHEGGAGVGFLEGGSDDKRVNSLYELRRGVAAKFVESLGLQVPAGLAEQGNLQQVGAELRAMYESDQAPSDLSPESKKWEEIYRLQDIREEGKKNVAEAEARVAEAKQKVDELTAQLEEERKAGGERVADLEGQLKTAKDTAAQREARLLAQAEALVPGAEGAAAQINSALETAVKDLVGGVNAPTSIPYELQAPLARGETLASRLAAIEAWKNEELKRQMDEEKRGLGVNPETGKAGDSKEHENSVKRAEGVLTKFAQGEVNEKTVRQTVNELRQIPGVGAALAESLTKMVDRLVANRSSLSDNDVTEVIGKDGKMRKLLGAPELAGIGAGAMAGMLPLFEGMFNTALASMGLAGR